MGATNAAEELLVYRLHQVQAGIDYLPASEITVDQIELNIQRGKMVALFGPTGCGKTTLLRVMAGLEQAAGGNVYLYGEDLTRLNDQQRAQLRRSKLGCIFGSDNLVHTLNVADNVALPAILSGTKTQAALENAGACLARVRASSLADRFPAELSWYQQQVVTLARCLTLKNPVILADEPTQNLSSVETKKFLALLRDLVVEGATCILTTHDQQVAQVADQIVDMLDGKIVG